MINVKDANFCVQLNVYKAQLASSISSLVASPGTNSDSGELPKMISMKKILFTLSLLYSLSIYGQDRDYLAWYDSEDMKPNPNCYWEDILEPRIIDLLLSFSGGERTIPEERVHEIMEHTLSRCMWSAANHPDVDTRLLCGRRMAVQIFLFSETEIIVQAANDIFSLTKNIDDFNKRYDIYNQLFWECEERVWEGASVFEFRK